MEIFALSGPRSFTRMRLPRARFVDHKLAQRGHVDAPIEYTYMASSLRGLGAVDMCSDRAMMAQTIITMASSALAAYGKAEESSSEEVGSAITGATQQWIARCAAAGASAAQIEAAKQQIELQKAQIALQVQQAAAQAAKDQAEAKTKNQQFLIGAGILGFLGVAVIMKMK